ncbi:hypothetical protein [Chromobacterium haemolyticum]|nr:hypothetical protein [Chromobacterium haemolyticum]
MGQGDTALHLAAASGDINRMRHEIDNNCDVNIVNTDGRAPAHFAAIKCKEQSDVNERGKILEGLGFLLKRGANFDLADNDGKTPRDYLPDW